MTNHSSSFRPFPMYSQHTMTTLLILITIMFTSMAMLSLHQDSTWVIEWELISINSSYMNLPIIIDSMGSFMAATVTFISFNIFIFSKSYMKNDPNQTRFLYILFIFIMSMIALIFSPNLLTLMLGWDGLGVTSFLLVIYYPTSNALKSGMVTALSNRIGDCFLLVAIVLSASQGQWNTWSPWEDSINIYSMVGLFILVAAMTKSAQAPFMVWLPEAMAAPTPVSALVHSSTLVTAGVYLIIRFYPFLMNISNLNMILCMSSSLTLIASSIWATVEYDIKKIIALSTLSHISMMMLMLSLGLPYLAFLHLLSHAMFKSLLFLTVGLHILYSNHQQNLQNLEAFRKAPSISMPATISLASLNAFFFTSGYFSKELMAETILFMPQYEMISSLAMNSVGTAVGSGLTYSVRIHRVLSNSTKLVRPDGTNIYKLYRIWYLNDRNSSVRTPIMFLSMGSLVMSSLAMWSFMSPYHMPMNNLYTHITPWMWSLMGLMSATSLCALNHKYKRTYHRKKNKRNKTQEINFEHIFNSSDNEEHLRHHNATMSGLTFLTYNINPHIMKLSMLIYKILDSGWLEMFPPSLLKMTSQKSSISISKYEATMISKWLFIMFMLLIFSMLLLNILMLNL